MNSVFIVLSIVSLSTFAMPGNYDQCYRQCWDKVDECYKGDSSTHDQCKKLEAECYENDKKCNDEVKQKYEAMKGSDSSAFAGASASASASAGASSGASGSSGGAGDSAYPSDTPESDGDSPTSNNTSKPPASPSDDDDTPTQSNGLEPTGSAGNSGGDGGGNGASDYPEEEEEEECDYEDEGEDANPATTNNSTETPSGGGKLASVTWYKKEINAGQGYPTTACGEGPDEWKSSGPLAAVSENFFGAKAGEGAGPGCGKCFKLKPVKILETGAPCDLPEIELKVVDLCPASGGALSDTGGGNEEWCTADMSTKNRHGFVMHFDMMYESLDQAPEWKNLAYKNNLIVEYSEC